MPFRIHVSIKASKRLPCDASFDQRSRERCTSLTLICACRRDGRKRGRECAFVCPDDRKSAACAPPSYVRNFQDEERHDAHRHKIGTPIELGTGSFHKPKNTFDPLVMLKLHKCFNVTDTDRSFPSTEPPISAAHHPGSNLPTQNAISPRLECKANWSKAKQKQEQELTLLFGAAQTPA